MAGQCLRGRPEAAQGRLHRAHREHHTTALPPASTHTSQAPVVAQQAPGEGSARHRVGGDWRWQKPRGNHPQISSERKLPSNPIGGGGRGSWGDCFALSVGGGGHRSWPEWSGDGGGDLGFARAHEEERGRERGLGWVGLTDPDPSRVGSTRPGGLVWA
jgi:hypothetical protein